MKQLQTFGGLKLIASLSVTLLLSSCTAGQFFPSQTLSRFHIIKNDDYKQRPGWNAIVRLGIEDCETYRKGVNSLLKWDETTCNEQNIIKAVNANLSFIPVFYAAYHEYGGPNVGQLSSLEDDEEKRVDIYAYLKNLAEALENKYRVDVIYIDYQKDYWNMGLGKVSETDFYQSISAFSAKKDQFDEKYQKEFNAFEEQYSARNEANKEREKEAYIASERTIYPSPWIDPTPDQKKIVDALRTVKFTARDNGMVYANGRSFISINGLSYLRNSLDMSMASCSDMGAYYGKKVLSRACVQGLAKEIVEWGKTARDRKISDNAWNTAAMDSIIDYTPVKYEILFSDWAGMARVYSARGY